MSFLNKVAKKDISEAQGDPYLHGELPLRDLRSFLDLLQDLQFVERGRGVRVELFI